MQLSLKVFLTTVWCLKCRSEYQKTSAQSNTVLFVLCADCPTELGGQERDGESFNLGLPSQPWEKQPNMDDSSSLGKVSSSTESVATVTSEEFVLVQPSAAGSPQGSEGKPRLKVRTTQWQTFTSDQNNVTYYFHAHIGFDSNSNKMDTPFVSL